MAREYEFDPPDRDEDRGQERHRDPSAVRSRDLYGDRYALMGPWGPIGALPYPYYPGGYTDWTRDDPRNRRRPGRDVFDRAGDEIASWFGDEDAEARREMDHRGRGPQGYQRSDDRILEDVNDHLTDDPVVDATDVSVTVTDREVTLDGHVGSGREKRRAEDCAEDVRGVEHVQNNLRVRRS